MTLTRADIKQILELRYEFTKERWGDGTIDAWWELLGDLDPNDVKRRLRELVRGGATHVPPGLLAQGLTATALPRIDRPSDCEHTERTDITPTHSRCNRCRADLHSANDPRIASQWARWVEEGRAQARADRTAKERM